MPVPLIPDSFGSTPLEEAWTDAARAASIAARQRRATVSGLKIQRADSLNKMLDLISTYGSIAKSRSAQQEWTRANDLSGEISRIGAQRAPRPFVARLRKALHKFRRAA